MRYRDCTVRRESSSSPVSWIIRCNNIFLDGRIVALDARSKGRKETAWKRSEALDLATRPSPHQPWRLLLLLPLVVHHGSFDFAVPLLVGHGFNSIAHPLVQQLMVLSPTGLKGCRIESREDHIHLQHQYCIDILISIRSMRCNIYEKYPTMLPKKE